MLNEGGELVGFCNSPKSISGNTGVGRAVVVVPERFRRPKVLMALSAEKEGMVGDAERLSSSCLSCPARRGGTGNA